MRMDRALQAFVGTGELVGWHAEAPKAGTGNDFSFRTNLVNCTIRVTCTVPLTFGSSFLDRLDTMTINVENFLLPAGMAYTISELCHVVYVGVARVG